MHELLDLKNNYNSMIWPSSSSQLEDLVAQNLQRYFFPVSYC